MTEAADAVPAGDRPDDHFRLSELVAIELGETARTKPIDLARAREILRAIERRVLAGETTFRRLAAAVQIEVAIGEAESEADHADPSGQCDPLFRLRTSRWAMGKDDLAELAPARDPQLRIIAFDFDVAEFMGVQTVDEFPFDLSPRRSFIVAFGGSQGTRRNPLLVDRLTARILTLSDGTRTAGQIVSELTKETGNSIRESLDWIENLFVQGLISLHDRQGQDDPVPEGARQGIPHSVS